MAHNYIAILYFFFPEYNKEAASGAVSDRILCHTGFYPVGGGGPGPAAAE